MSDNWSTPQALFDELNREFDFDLDACASSWNYKVGQYFTEEDDALSKQWCGDVWMNPPYSKNQLEKWIRKAYMESKRGVTVVALIPARVETKYFHDYCLSNEIRFIRGRIHFMNEFGVSGRPRFGSMVVIFRKHSRPRIGPTLNYRGGK